MVPGSGTDPFTQIGRVVKSHGSNGELKIRLDIDPSSLNEFTFFATCRTNVEIINFRELAQ